MSYQYNKQVPHGKPPDIAVAIAEHFLVAMKRLNNKKISIQASQSLPIFIRSPTTSGKQQSKLEQQ